jgi:hypothetical protein
MNRYALAALAVSAALVAMPLAVLADEATDTFNSLYGQKLKKAAGTTDATDDVALAAELLTAAKASTKQTGLLTLLCENAYALGQKAPAGYTTAAEAIQLLADKVPQKKSDCQQKLLTMYQRQLDGSRGAEQARAAELLIGLLMGISDEKADASDFAGAASLAENAMRVATVAKLPTKDIQDQLKELYDRVRMDKQIAALKARLASNGQDVLARAQLILLYVVELDNPAEAAKFLDASSDEAMRNYVPLAAKDIKSVDEAACLGLGEWYQGLVGKTTVTRSKEAMLERAKAYYEAYLEKHTAEDLSRTKAKLALKNVEEALARLSPPEDASTWGDLLRVTDLAKYKVAGKWEMKDGKLTGGPERQARVTVPVIPDGTYKMQIKFIRVGGSGEVAVKLPVGAEACHLVLGGYGGDTSGLETINGKRADENETTVRQPKLTNGQEQTVDVNVSLRGKDATIVAELNGKSYIRWQGAQSALSPARGWDLPEPKTLGLGAMDSTVIFTSAKLKMVSGEARLLQENRDEGNPTIVVQPRHWNQPRWRGPTHWGRH